MEKNHIITFVVSRANNNSMETFVNQARGFSTELYAFLNF